MKVYQLRLILGKATNYDQNGKLKNQTITAKYAGEMELENILEDQNWKKLGACEISCVGVFDTETKEQDVTLMGKINDRLKASIQAGTKPKTEIELLKEQIASLTEKVNNPVIVEKEIVTQLKEDRVHLFEEATELGLKPSRNIKTDILKDLIANAKKEKA
jgi:hypothetical protein